MSTWRMRRTRQYSKATREGFDACRQGHSDERSRPRLPGRRDCRARRLHRFAAAQLTARTSRGLPQETEDGRRKTDDGSDLARYLFPFLLFRLLSPVSRLPSTARVEQDARSFRQVLAERADRSRDAVDSREVNVGYEEYPHSVSRAKDPTQPVTHQSPPRPEHP